MYYAQLLEVELVMLLTVANRLKQPGMSSDEIDKIEVVELNEKTLGGLLADLRVHVRLASHTDTLLREALQLRNFMAHHFFKENGELMLTESGAKAMIQGLEKSGGTLRTGYEAAKRIVGKVAQLAFGPSYEELESRATVVQVA